MKPIRKSEIDDFLFKEIQLILAEKQTSLSTLRTGIAVFALPLSVLSLLVATSRFYSFTQELGFLIPLLILNFVLIALGTYLIVRALRKIHHLDKLIRTIKVQHSALADYLE